MSQATIVQLSTFRSSLGVQAAVTCRVKTSDGPASRSCAEAGGPAVARPITRARPAADHALFIRALALHHPYFPTLNTTTLIPGAGLSISVVNGLAVVSKALPPPETTAMYCSPFTE
jgi:hypothetical protein